MQLIAICNKGNEYLHSLINCGKAEKTIVLLLGGTIPSNKNRTDSVYSITGRFDDHHIARLLEEKTIFIESRVQYIGDNWYIAGIGGRDPIANVNAVERALDEILVKGTKKYLILATYFCPYGICDKSPLGGRRGLHELLEIINNYPVKLLISCDCGPGVVEYKDVTIVCLGNGSCTSLTDLNNEGLSSRVHCGE